MFDLTNVVSPRPLLGHRICGADVSSDFLPGQPANHAYVYRIWGAHLDYISGDCSVSEDRGSLATNRA